MKFRDLKDEDIDRVMNGCGLVWSPRTGFLFGWDRGWFIDAPMWFKHTIVDMVNPIMCVIYGHKPIGPISADHKTMLEKTCYICGKKLD